MKLYELSEQYNKLQELISEGTDKEMFADSLEGLEGDIEDKAENMAKLIRSLETEADGIKSEEERLYSRRMSISNRITDIKEYLQFQLSSMNIDKVKGKLFTVAMQNNPQSVKLLNDNVMAFNQKYIVVSRTLDKKAILEDLKAGDVVEGAELQQTKSLRIR